MEPGFQAKTEAVALVLDGNRIISALEANSLGVTETVPFEGTPGEGSRFLKFVGSQRRAEVTVDCQSIGMKGVFRESFRLLDSF